MGRRLDMGDIQFIKLLDVSEDLAKLGAEFFRLFSGQSEPRQMGDVFDVNVD